jgi:hypothetical protein
MLERRRHFSFTELSGLYLAGLVSMARLSEAHIFHQEWCASNSDGTCDCDPDVLLPRQTEPSEN